LINFNLGEDLKEQRKAVRKELSFYHSNETKFVMVCLKQLLKGVKKQLKAKTIHDLM